jgi:hypothetical protein
MDGHIKDDRLFNFFNIKLDGPIKFGKHQIFDECAADCEAEAKTKLRACGMEIQKLVQLGREKLPRKRLKRLVINYKHAAKISKPSARKNGGSSAVTLHCITFWTNTLQSKAPL